MQDFAGSEKVRSRKIALIKKLGEQETVEALVVNFKRELGNSIEIPLPARKQPNPTSIHVFPRPPTSAFLKMQEKGFTTARAVFRLRCSSPFGKDRG